MRLGLVFLCGPARRAVPARPDRPRRVEEKRPGGQLPPAPLRAEAALAAGYAARFCRRFAPGALVRPGGGAVRVFLQHAPGPVERTGDLCPESSEVSGSASSVISPRSLGRPVRRPRLRPWESKTPLAFEHVHGVFLFGPPKGRRSRLGNTRSDTKREPLTVCSCRGAAACANRKPGQASDRADRPGAAYSFPVAAPD